MEAMILDIQRMSTEDGPGLRTTVFFKGCNLACPWCHNPESISRKPDLNWFSRRCIGCGLCAEACPQKGITRDEGGVNFNRSACLACYACANECPAGAIELKGKPWDVDSLAAELLKDRAYFGGEGGVTLSGGEVMMQSEAAAMLAKKLKEAGANVALDTAGCYDFALLEKILPHIDLVLYDLKIFDGEAHKEIVGADNRRILENFRLLCQSDFSQRHIRDNANEGLWVRTPIIEGATDGEDNIAAIGAFIAESCEGGALPERWELCAFNNLCRDKYERLDLDWQYGETKLTEKSRIEKLAAIARRFVPCATYTGTTAVSTMQTIGEENAVPKRI